MKHLNVQILVFKIVQKLMVLWSIHETGQYSLTDEQFQITLNIDKQETDFELIN